MSKISKIQNLKLERRHKNETMSILNHMNSKLGTPSPSIADKSINGLKYVKPEIQSSRLPRYEPGRSSSKQAIRCGNNKQRLDYSEIGEKLSSKSLESRQGSIQTYRIQNKKTKKNSSTRVMTEANILNHQQSPQSIQKRLKTLIAVFSKKDQNYISQKNMKDWQVPTNYISIKQPQYTNNYHKGTHINQQNISSDRMIMNLQSKFTDWDIIIRNRKSDMTYDTIDHLIQCVFNQLRTLFNQIIGQLVEDSQCKLAIFKDSIEQLIEQHNEKIVKQQQKVMDIKNLYVCQIQNLLVKSLYATDKINQMQRKGLLNFEMRARQIDSEDKKILQNRQLRETQVNYFSQSSVFDNQMCYQSPAQMREPDMTPKLQPRTQFNQGFIRKLR